MEYKTDVALLSVTPTEAGAVRHFFKWEPENCEEDAQIYERSSFLNDGKTCSLVHAQAEDMGMPAAAALAMKVIWHYRPRYLIMVGIAAGVAKEELEDQQYGDVVVADVVWNYSSGKFTHPESAEIAYGDLGFEPRPVAETIPEDILALIREAASSPRNPCHIYIGPMACGTSVVANRSVIEKQIYQQYRHTAGLDMESYGAVYAANHAPAPRPKPIILKSVCDFADHVKSDEFQRFAAYSSCEFAKFLIEEVLPME